MDQAGDLDRRSLQHVLHERHGHRAHVRLADGLLVVAIGGAHAGKRHALLAVEQLVAGLDMDGRLILRVHLVVDGVGHVHVDAADRIHELGQPGELDFHVVGDLHAGEVLHRCNGASRPVHGEHLVDLLDLAVVLVRRVARNRHHGDDVAHRIDAHEHEGVGALPVRLPVVRAHQQHVERLHLGIGGGENAAQLALLLSVERHVAGEAARVPSAVRGDAAHEHHDDGERDKRRPLQLGVLLALLAHAHDLVSLRSVAVVRRSLVWIRRLPRRARSVPTALRIRPAAMGSLTETVRRRLPIGVRTSARSGGTMATRSRLSVVVVESHRENAFPNRPSRSSRISSTLN